jgi:hypothetical protein
MRWRLAVGGRSSRECCRRVEHLGGDRECPHHQAAVIPPRMILTAGGQTDPVAQNSAARSWWIASKMIVAAAAFRSCQLMPVKQPSASSMAANSCRRRMFVAEQVGR